MAKKRPAMSVQLAKAKTASDLGEIIADSWKGYGLKGDVVSSNDTAQLMVVTKPETLTEAFRYLWLKNKGKDGDSVIYRMGGMPYEILVAVDGEKHNIMIRKPMNVGIKALQLVKKHLAGKHPQKSHAGSGGGGSGVSGGNKPLSKTLPNGMKATISPYKDKPDMGTWDVRKGNIVYGGGEYKFMGNVNTTTKLMKDIAGKYSAMDAD